ncbi:MBL fold metallo-hydrolase [Sinomicrobium soli]|uniref:MBL fold metallo-hydrolase n=1 Tax=Sinomicrobium sp. N-1-3-6 TaxID=2219864 RepID=UPI00191C65A6|nr:MBL fold metallo-hydrolase [Sinomicrobium sp. N-1-3-6]
MIIFLSLLAILVISLILYLQHPQFGKAPSGDRLERLAASPHFRDGVFENLSYTPPLTEGYTYLEVMYMFFFKKSPDNVPKGTIPSVRTDLKTLPEDEDILVWFGHSSYFLRVKGVSILVDPVFSGNASPVPGSTRAFKGTDIYDAEDFPDIDYLLITHDHYDHLDYKTIGKLKDKVKKVICGLGVGAHLEYWGYPAGMVEEHDWNETVVLEGQMRLHTLPARHFSGRLFKRNNTLWMSYLLETGSQKIYLGGDSGYDRHFAEIGKRFGPIDLAILENGQYNVAWHAIHCLPEETVQAALDLGARRLMPVHSSKFSLSPHGWKEPLTEVSRYGKDAGIPLVTPVIGQKVRLDDDSQVFEPWWERVN